MARLTHREQLASLLYYAAILLLGYLVYEVFRPFLVPLAWASILVVLFHDWHGRLKARWGDSLGAAASTGIVTAILIVPSLALALAFVHETLEVTANLEQAFNQGRLPWLARAWDWVASQVAGAPSLDLPTLVHGLGSAIGGRAAEVLGLVLRHAAGFAFDLFVVLFSLFFLFRDGEGFEQKLRALLPFDKGEGERVVNRTKQLIRATVSTSLTIAGLQGTIGGMAFWVVGISAPFFWGVMVAFFSLVPVVGSTVIWVPAAAWLAATGHWEKAIALVFICGLLMSIVEHVVRPVLLSGRLGLSGLVVFISVLGGLTVFGALGIVLGPVLVATAAGVLETYTEE